MHSPVLLMKSLPEQRGVTSASFVVDRLLSVPNTLSLTSIGVHSDEPWQLLSVVALNQVD